MLIYFFFVIFGYYVINDQRRNVKIEYGIKEKTEYIGKDEIRSIKEYYSFDPERIRSEKYWINGKKDSIWSVYTEDGAISNQVKYKKGALIKTIK